MRLDSQDKRMLAALDDGFTIDSSGAVATVSGVKTITLMRTAADRLLLTIEFSDCEFPILLSRTQTLRQLGVRADDDARSDC